MAQSPLHESPAVSRRMFLGVLGAAAAALAVAGCGGDGTASPATTGGSTSTGGSSTGGGSSTSGPQGPRLDGVSIEVRRDPGCGCCLSWVEYATGLGAAVTVTEDAQRADYRKTVGIPDAAASCHTGVTGKYAIEGHVPAEAIKKLLADQPDAAGIAVPGMPGDSPGMGGDQTTWAAQHVVLVAADGTLTDFSY